MRRVIRGLLQEKCQHLLICPGGRRSLRQQRREGVGEGLGLVQVQKLVIFSAPLSGRSASCLL